MSDKPIFDKPNVLVTGGAGFIGSFLCEKLLNDSRVVCIDNFSTSQENNIDHLLKNPDFEFIRADINEPIDFTKYPELERFQLKFQGIQEIYHLACPTSAKKFEELRHQTLMANSVGMRNVLDVAVANKAKLFFASSSVIYGGRPEDGHLFKEEEYGTYDHLTPRSCYDEGKRWAETMAYTYRQVHNIDVRIGRIFRTFGPRMLLNDGQMIPDFIINALDGRDLTVYGDESFRTSLIYVSDVVDGILRLMRLPKDPGVVNIGSDYDIRITDVAKKIIELTGSTSKLNFEAPLLFMSQLGLPDLSRAKDQLGWLPLISLEAGLKRSIEYTIAHRGLLARHSEGNPRMKIFAVVPNYNERGRIGAVVRDLLPRVHRVIVVDDGSSDGSAQEAREAGADVVEHVLNRGQGAALKTGTVLAAAEGADVIVHIDADGQHDPEAIPVLVAPILDGRADAVFGSRFLGISSEGMPASRRALLSAARLFSSTVLGIPRTVTDPQSGMRALTPAAAAEIDFCQDRMAHCSEILRNAYASDLRCVEVPIKVRYTADTLAKGQKAADAFKIVWQLLLGSFQR